MLRTIRDTANTLWNRLAVAWALALVSTLAALFIGEVMGQTPCNLCWFQRAFMFPLAIILGIACLNDDLIVWRYALPVAGIGWLIAVYHSLLYIGIIPPTLEPCSEGVSCSGATMRIFGVVPLPLLSLLSFSLISWLLISLRKGHP